MSRSNRTNWQQEMEQSLRNRDLTQEMLKRGNSWAQPQMGRKPGTEPTVTLNDKINDVWQYLGATKKASKQVDEMLASNELESYWEANVKNSVAFRRSEHKH